MIKHNALAQWQGSSQYPRVAVYQLGMPWTWSPLRNLLHVIGACAIQPTFMPYRWEKMLYLRQSPHYNSVTIIWTPADPNWNDKGLSNQFSLQRSSFLLNQLLVQTRIPELVFFPKPLLSYSPTLILKCFAFSVPSPFLQALNPHTIHLYFLYILISLRIVLVR